MTTEPVFSTSKTKKRIKSQYKLSFRDIKDRMPYLATELLKDVPVLTDKDKVYLANIPNHKIFGAIEEAQTFLLKQNNDPYFYKSSFYSFFKTKNHLDSVKGKILACGKKKTLVRIDNIVLTIPTDNVNTKNVKFPRYTYFIIEELNPLELHIVLKESNLFSSYVSLPEEDLDSIEIERNIKRSPVFKINEITDNPNNEHIYRVNTICNLYIALTGKEIPDDLYNKLLESDLKTVYETLSLVENDRTWDLYELLKTPFLPIESFIRKKQKFRPIALVDYVDPFIKVINLSYKQNMAWVHKKLLNKSLSPLTGGRIRNNED